MPEDFQKRLRKCFEGKQLQVDVFGPEDMIILKCMAGRPKDRTHLRLLIRQPGLQIALIENHLQKLNGAGLERAPQAAALFEELCDELPNL